MKLIDFLILCQNITICLYINKSFLIFDTPNSILNQLNYDALTSHVYKISGDMYNNAIDVYVKDNRRL